MKTVTKSLTVTTLFVVVALLFPARSEKEIKNDASKVLGISTQAQTLIKPAPEFLNVPTTPELTARAAFAYDLGSGSILYTNNFDEILPIASLTKLMTALVVSERLDLNSVVTVEKEDTLVIGTNMGLIEGERIRANDVLRGMLIPSSNDAAKALARTTAGSESKFVDLMNAKAKSLGMTSTHFTNPTGLDSDDSNSSTTYDLARLVNEFLKNKILSEIVSTKEDEVRSLDNRFFHPLRTTNKLLIENPEVFGIKTGFTSLAKGNLIILQRHEQAEIVTIVLGSDNREEDTKKLLDWVLAVYRW